ncbi:hypothetical protein [Haloplanus sp.]|uniref:hypothetical protein n=1 Tax=Haloplanus sp. TaxID=1961696 RepID=UPI00263519B3|nr:hypothetical protein [Haloplanus sp.]
MSSVITQLANRTPLTEHEFGDETLEQALDEAFEHIGVDTMVQADAFQEVLDMDALNNLHDGSSTSQLCTTFVLYGHTVSVTSEAVRVYEAAG